MGELKVNIVYFQQMGYENGFLKKPNLYGSSGRQSFMKGKMTLRALNPIS
ncbi:MAG: hypothetical protein AB1611_11170 [bacterium]